jgi:hypothetical protein
MAVNGPIPRAVALDEVRLAVRLTNANIQARLPLAMGKARRHLARRVSRMTVQVNCKSWVLQFFRVLDGDDAEFDSDVDGKGLTQQLGAVNGVADKPGLRRFEDCAFQDLSDFGGPELQPQWFEATEGVE